MKTRESSRCDISDALDPLIQREFEEEYTRLRIGSFKRDMQRFNETGSIYLGRSGSRENDEREGWFSTRARLMGRAAMLNRGTLVHYESHLVPASNTKSDLEDFLEGNYEKDIYDLRVVFLAEPNGHFDNIIRTQNRHYFEADELTGQPLTGRSIAVESIRTYLAGERNAAHSDELAAALIQTRGAFQNLKDAQLRSEPHSYRRSSSSRHS